MKLSFTETMRGEVTDGAGEVHPIAFHIRTAQVAGGLFRIEGIVHADVFGDEAPCQGTLTLSAAPPSIHYALFWSAGDRHYELRGAKSPRPLAPVQSMTILPVTLSHPSGLELASGTMHFGLFELPTFLASWLPVPTRARRQFEARCAAVARRALLGEST